MEQPPLSPNDSISIIEQAIMKAKREKTGAAFYYILWGSILFLYGLINYLVLSFPSNTMKTVLSFSWFLFPVGGLLSFLQTKKTDKIEKVKPINENLYMVVWGGVGLCFAVITIFGLMTGHFSFILPTVLLLLGFASFITGGVTRFRPSIIGGALCIICAGVTMVLPLALQFLIGAIAMLIANVVPGILMKKTMVVDV